MTKFVALNRIMYGGKKDDKGLPAEVVFEEGDEVAGVPDDEMRKLFTGGSIAPSNHRNAMAAVDAKTARERAAKAADRAADDRLARQLAEDDEADKAAKAAADKNPKKVPA